jgi:hypothetical protein
MVIAALGCSFAWGIIDAGMYLMAGLGERGPAALTMSIGKNTRKPVAAASAMPRTMGKVKSDMEQLAPLGSQMIIQFRAQDHVASVK